MMAVIHHPLAMMKTLLLLFTLLLSATQAAPISQITTLRGKVYRQCEVVTVYPDGVSFTHAKGAAKVLFTDLSKEWRRRLGYDAGKAAAYQKELAEKRAEEKAARARQEEARFKALAEAAERARIQSLGQQAQARAVVPSTAFAPSLVPVLPALGAVHDPGNDYGRYDRHRQVPLWQNGGYGGYPGSYYGSVGGYGLGWGVCHPAPPICPPLRTFRVTIRH